MRLVRWFAVWVLGLLLVGVLSAHLTYSFWQRGYAKRTLVGVQNSRVRAARTWAPGLLRSALLESPLEDVRTRVEAILKSTFFEMDAAVLLPGGSILTSRSGHVDPALLNDHGIARWPPIPIRGDGGELLGTLVPLDRMDAGGETAFVAALLDWMGGDLENTQRRYAFLGSLVSLLGASLLYIAVGLGVLALSRYRQACRESEERAQQIRSLEVEGRKLEEGIGARQRDLQSLRDNLRQVTDERARLQSDLDAAVCAGAAGREAAQSALEELRNRERDLTRERDQIERQMAERESDYQALTMELQKARAPDRDEWVRTLEEMIKSLEADKHHLEEALKIAKRRVYALEQGGSSSPTTGIEVVEEVLAPVSLQDAVQIAKRRCGGRVIFGADVDRGLATIQGSAGSLEKLVRWLVALADLTDARRSGSVGDDPLRRLSERGVTVSDEAQNCSQDPSEMAKRTWDAGGTSAAFVHHMKPSMIARVYFRWDATQDAHVVGWIGKHP